MCWAYVGAGSPLLQAALICWSLLVAGSFLSLSPNGSWAAFTIDTLFCGDYLYMGLSLGMQPFWSKPCVDVVAPPSSLLCCVSVLSCDVGIVIALLCCKGCPLSSYSASILFYCSYCWRSRMWHAQSSCPLSCCLATFVDVFDLPGTLNWDLLP